LDGQGIPLWDPRSFRLAGPPLYHPTVIIQYGLAHHDRAVDGDSSAEEVFLRCARWVEDHAIGEPRGRFVVWPFPFPLRTPRIAPNWISGMTQGQALSLLTRAFAMTGAARTAEIAHRAARSFCFSVEEGGVVSQSRSGSMFIEEVAAAPKLHILNGALYGLFGLHEYLQSFDDPELQPVFEKCTEGIDEALPFFDMGWWSRYSLGLRWHVASEYYHGVHIRLLANLARELDRPEFNRYAERWERQRRSTALRVRRTVVGAIEVTLNRTLTVTGLDKIKYRQVAALEG
jgi:hypothetical protein